MKARNSNVIRSQTADLSLRGFTLVELLIVVAIIAILIQLMLPAIQASREAARRTDCLQRLRQWGLAVQTYESSHRSFPVASMRSPTAEEAEKKDEIGGDDMVIPPLGPTGNRQGWPPRLWAYVEQQALADRYDFDKAFYEAPNTVPNSYDGLCAQFVPTYFCPSDRGSPAYITHDEFWRSRGNYVMNWGPIPFQTLEEMPKPSARAPFGFRDFFSRHKPYVAQFASITDGASNTLLMSESIMHPEDSVWDQRGDIINDDGGGGIFMTLDPPNGGVDLLKFKGGCQNQADLPCSVAKNNWEQKRFAVQMAARSRHPGGVNTVGCDGSSRFIADDIELGVWQVLSTINGGETASFP